MNGDMRDGNEEGGERGVSGDVAVVGESSASTQITIQTLQGIYNELTGKSEKVGKSYSRPFQIGFSDIEQLNKKIEQAHHQYNIVASHCNVTVYYVDDTRDRFSSFCRFALHNAGSSSAVESILIKYHFLVCLPKTKRPQTYTVSIRMASRVAITKRMMSEFYGAPPPIFRLMGNRTAVVDVEYVDYMVARNFLNIIDEWIKFLPAAFENKFLNWLQRRSHAIPRIARFFSTMFVGSTLLIIAPHFISKESIDLLAFGRFYGCGLLGVYGAYAATSWCAGWIEDGLDEYSELSYLKLTKGDEKEISDAGRGNKFSFVKGVGGFVLTVCISISTNLIADYLTH
ncbi:hypothetical protein ACI2VA_04345 [Ralstonia nicotianae]